MQKPNTPANEQDRQEALDSYGILDSLPEQSFDDLTFIASQICQTPIALISLVDKERQWFKSKYGLDAEETPRDISFCGHAINQPDEIFEVQDAKKDERFQDNPLVAGALNIGFYAGVPLVDSSNHALGTLCVISSEPQQLSKEQRKALQALAREVMSKIELRKDNLQLNSAIVKGSKDLSDSKSKFYSLYHDAPDMMCSVDSLTKEIIEYNETLCRRLGYTSEEIRRKDIFELYHFDCHEAVRVAFDEFLKKGKVHNRRLILKTKEGQKLNVALSVRAVRDDNGLIKHSNSIWRDIDDLVKVEGELITLNSQLEAEVEKRTRELSQTQKFLQKVTDIAPSIIYVFNHENMSNEYSNREIGEVLGYSEREIQDLGELLMPTLCHPDDLGKVMVHLGKIQEIEDSETISIEYRMKHKGGEYKWLFSEDTVFERSKNNKVSKHIGVATDVTALKKAQEELLKQSEVLKAQNDDLKQFTNVATHDLKNPVITLKGHFDYLKGAFTERSEEVEESIGFVEEEIDTLTLTLNRLTEAIRLRETSVELQQVQLNTMIEQIMVSYNGQIEQLGGTIDLELEVGAIARGTELFVRSIIQNLITNSIKYRSSDKKLAISISTEVEKEYVSLIIGDNGLGIDLSLQKDKLFEMFNRFHHHTEGSGMGLYMVKSMVEKLGGTIMVKSEVNRGTEFTIRLKRDI